MTEIIFRLMNIEDLLNVQKCNFECLPENYQLKYYIYHLVSWPYCSFIAETQSDRKLVGYILGKVDEAAYPFSGHITSLAVYPDFRNFGIARKLMDLCIESFKKFGVRYVTLHVRKSNAAALRLYREKLEFEIVNEEIKYYADGEDALSLKKKLI